LSKSLNCRCQVLGVRCQKKTLTPGP